MGCVNSGRYSTGGHNIVSNIFDMPSPTDVTCEHQYEKAEKRNRSPFDSLLHFTHDNFHLDNVVLHE